MAAAFRKDVQDKEQVDLENAEFENSVPVFMDKKTRIIVRGNSGGSENVSHAVGSRHKNAGVVSPASDRAGLFQEELAGRK